MHKTNKIMVNNVSKKYIRAAEIIKEYVGATYGPNGGTVAIEKLGRSPQLTKDGITVLSNLISEDLATNTAIKIIREASSKTNKEVGDGTTTTALLASQLILNQDPTVIQYQEDIINNVKSLSRPVNTEEEAIKVATISCNGDTELGTVIGKLLFQLKDSGVIEVKPSNTAETYYDFRKGSTFDTGYIFPTFINNQRNRTVEYDNPRIILCKYEVTSLTDETFSAQLEDAVRKNQPVVIIANKFSNDILNLVLENQRKGIIICPVISPAFAADRENLMNDMFIITSKQAGNNTCEKIIISENTLTIIEGAGDPEKIQTHINNCNLSREAHGEVSYKYKTLERINNIKGSTGIIYIGAKSTLEFEEKMFRVDDAICATKSALRNGYCVGAGYTYYKAIKELPGSVLDVFKAAIAPVFNRSYIYYDDNKVYNIKAKKVEDIENTEVLDATDVIVHAINNAFNIYRLVLDSKSFIIETYEQ